VVLRGKPVGAKEFLEFGQKGVFRHLCRFSCRRVFPFYYVISIKIYIDNCDKIILNILTDYFIVFFGTLYNN